MALNSRKIILLFAILISTVTNTFATPYATYGIHYPVQVNQLLNQMNPQNLWTNLISLTQFPDRGSSHQSGVAAANWIQSQIATYVKNSGRTDTQIYTIATTGIDPATGQPFNVIQPSVILKIGNSTQPGVVIGGHFDTVQCDDEGCKTDPLGPFPGANDDGSGSTTLLEVTRTILSSGMQFKNPIYIIWYAAEENGTWGSIAVVNNFKKNNIPVKAVMQLDQTGFAYHNDPTMYLETGRLVNQDLTLYLKDLITTYVKKPVVIPGPNCHGDSDEWSWSDNGYIDARPLESDYCSDNIYPYFHTNQDTMDKISLSHMTDYLKLSIAFVVELAEPLQH